MTKRMACLLGLALCLLSARASAFDVRTATAATYAGEYQFSSGYLVSIWRNADELLFQAVGQPRIVLSPTSAIQVLPTGDGVPFSQESEFKVKGGKVRIRFASDEDGNITSLQYEGGWDRCTAGFKALKLSESSGRAVLDQYALCRGRQVGLGHLRDRSLQRR
jgi:hypothetical protein